MVKDGHNKIQSIDKKNYCIQKHWFRYIQSLLKYSYFCEIYYGILRKVSPPHFFHVLSFNNLAYKVVFYAFGNGDNTIVNNIFFWSQVKGNTDCYTSRWQQIW